MRYLPQVCIDWRLMEADDEALDAYNCLYAICRRKSLLPLYLGKAGDCTIDERLRCLSKDRVYARLREKGYPGPYVVAYGELSLLPNTRLTGQLLTDIESLLIIAEQPPGNRQCLNSRISRGGLFVRCTGDWGGRADEYFDNDLPAKYRLTA